MPRFGTEDGLWNAFETDLVRRLGNMRPGHFMIITHPDLSDDHYVQFAVQPDWTLQGECSGAAPMTSIQRAQILSFGWDDIDSRGGWPNYRVFWQPGLRSSRSLGEADVLDAASMVTTTLRVAFAVENPRQMHFEHGSFE